MDPRSLSIADYTYDLPDDRIARHPLPVRNASRLLVCEKGRITDDHFYSLADHLRRGDSLVLNTTRVIPARLHFRKKSGAHIEVFCLDPTGTDHTSAMSSRGQSVWNCLVGGAKRWKQEDLLLEFEAFGAPVQLSAKKLRQHEGQFVIAFEWSPAHLTFSEILAHAGALPLPPYFDREVEEEDYERYQTVVASAEGSVAAPTAALHFTEEQLRELAMGGIRIEHLTLHVGAGTFRPVTADQLVGHPMHAEPFSVKLDLLERIAANVEGRIIPVGTTCLRSLESLYWLAASIQAGRVKDKALSISQWQWLDPDPALSRAQAMRILVDHCAANGSAELEASTSIMIAPGYALKVADGLITNFHQPGSTLILLVAALLGEDWRKVYAHALSHGYRFLSYGDSSLLLP